ncbi:MAG: hypothetical protein WC401_09240 [Bacteroidales bacterium]
MTEDDKKLISKYMGWSENPYWWCEKCKEEKAPHHATYAERCSDCGCPVILKDDHNFDANDAALCVQEMQKRGEWLSFLKYVNTSPLLSKPANWYSFWPDDFISYLFNAENFFTAMSQWLKERGK